MPSPEQMQLVTKTEAYVDRRRDYLTTSADQLVLAQDAIDAQHTSPLRPSFLQRLVKYSPQTKVLRELKSKYNSVSDDFYENVGMFEDAAEEARVAQEIENLTLTEQAGPTTIMSRITGEIRGHELSIWKRDQRHFHVASYGHSFHESGGKIDGKPLARHDVERILNKYYSVLAWRELIADIHRSENGEEIPDIEEKMYEAQRKAEKEEARRAEATREAVEDLLR